MPQQNDTLYAARLQDARTYADFFRLDRINAEGGIVSEGDRVEMLDNSPTLMIGLGGTGVDALLRVKYEINRRFELPEGKQKPIDVDYIAIDTDQAKVSEACRGLRMDDTEFCLLKANNIAAQIANPHWIMDEWLKDWLSPRLKVVGSGNGANGKRQVGRFFLFSNAERVIRTVKTKLDALYLNKTNSTGVNVFIFSGISGGTGAGTFLDIAYIVHQLLHELSPAAPHTVAGFLFLPDVNLSVASLPDETRTFIRTNGYASLRELDYWMGASARGEQFKQRYTTNFEVNSEDWLDKMPFKLCTLISAESTLGISGEDAYEYAKRVAAEMAVTFIAGEEVTHSDGKGGKTSAFHSWLNNIDTSLSTKEKKLCGNHYYMVVGVDARTLQKDEILNYIAHLLLQRVDKLQSNNPSEAAVASLFGNVAHLSPNHMEMEMRTGVPLLSVEELKAEIPLDAFKARTVNMAASLEAAVSSAVDETFPNNSRTLLEKTMKDIIGGVEAAFKDAKGNKGPYYAHKLLYDSDVGRKTLLDLIAEARGNVLSAQRRDESQLPQLNRLTETAFKSAVAKPKKKTLHQYIEAAHREYAMRMRAATAEAIVGFYDSLSKRILQYNNDIVDKFMLLLKALAHVFADNANVMTSVAEKHTGSDITYEWKVAGFDKIKPVIEEALEDIDFTKNEEFVSRFLDFALKNSGVFLSDSASAERLSRILASHIEQQYGKCLGESIEQQLAEANGIPYIKGDKNSAFIAYVKNRLMPDMQKASKPMFALNTVLFNETDGVPYAYASIHKDTIALNNGVEEFIKANNISVTVKESHVSNRMFWLNSLSGVPLYAYAELIEYESAYRRIDPAVMGSHIRMGLQDDWNSIPSPIPEEAWRGTYVYPEEKERCAKARAVFDEALEKGVIQDLGTNGMYVRCVENPVALDAWKIVASEIKNADVMQLMHFEFSTKSKAGMTLAEKAEERLRQFRECFTRTPNLQKLVEEQLKLYGGVAKNINAIPGFAEWMVYGAIDFVSDIVYCFRGDLHNPAFEILNLGKLARAPKYQLFALFEAAEELPAENKRVLALRMKETKDVIADALKNPEEAEKAMLGAAARLKELRGDVTDTVTAINRDLSFDNTASKPKETREFYKGMLEYVNVLAESAMFRKYMK